MCSFSRLPSSVCATKTLRAEAKQKRKKSKTGDPGERDTYYCYTDEEREAAIAKFGNNAEITRFKGLGEINGVEFAEFIGPDMRLDPVTLKKTTP